MSAKVQTTLQEDFKKIRAINVKTCRICDQEGYQARYCPKFGQDVWCRICGDDFHVDKFCTRDKSECSRCGQKDDHHSILHMTKDMHKRLVLLKLPGDHLAHFIRIPMTGQLDNPSEDMAAWIGARRSKDLRTLESLDRSRTDGFNDRETCLCVCDDNLGNQLISLDLVYT